MGMEENTFDAFHGIPGSPRKPRCAQRISRRSQCAKRSCVGRKRISCNCSNSNNHYNKVVERMGQKRKCFKWIVNNHNKVFERMGQKRKHSCKIIKRTAD